MTNKTIENKEAVYRAMKKLIEWGEEEMARGILAMYRRIK